MSWSEIKKAVNSDISIPLNKAIGEYYIGTEKVIPRYYLVKQVLADYPLKMSGSAVDYNGTIFLFGVDNGDGNGAVHVYVLITSGFMFVGTYPWGTQVVDKGSAVVFHDKIYLGVTSKGVFTFDPVTYEWGEVPNVPNNTSGNPKSLAVYNDKLHLFHLYNNITHYIYDEEGQVWTSAAAPSVYSPGGNYGFPSIQVGDTLYVCFIGDSNRVYLWTWNGTSWTQNVSLSYTSYTPLLNYIDGDLYITFQYNDTTIYKLSAPYTTYSLVYHQAKDVTKPQIDNQLVPGLTMGNKIIYFTYKTVSNERKNFAIKFNPQTETLGESAYMLEENKTFDLSNTNLSIP